MTSTFKRYEYKYRINHDQYQELKRAMEGKMKLDDFGKHTINNIYFDTPDYLLIRRSLEKPVYKEKLRIRWYGTRGSETPVFIELKKKYKGVVYKRRIKQTWEDTRAYFHENIPLKSNKNQQILRELDYFLKFYLNIGPALFLAYDREAYYGMENGNFRMTFDFNLRYKESEDLFEVTEGGKSVIDSSAIILEIKTGEGIPQWLLDFFAQEKVYRTSFSKYGTVYKEILLPPKLGGVANYA